MGGDDAEERSQLLVAMVSKARCLVADRFGRFRGDLATPRKARDTILGETPTASAIVVIVTDRAALAMYCLLSVLCSAIYRPVLGRKHEGTRMGGGSERPGRY